MRKAAARAPAAAIACRWICGVCSLVAGVTWRGRVAGRWGLGSQESCNVVGKLGGGRERGSIAATNGKKLKKTWEMGKKWEMESIPTGAKQDKAALGDRWQVVPGKKALLLGRGSGQMPKLPVTNLQQGARDRGLSQLSRSAAAVMEWSGCLPASQKGSQPASQAMAAMAWQQAVPVWQQACEPEHSAGSVRDGVGWAHLM